MAATIEIKYYNSFWLKKISTINAVIPTTAVSVGDTTSNSLIISVANSKISVGQRVSWKTGSTSYTSSVVKVNGTTITISTIPGTGQLPSGTTVTFGAITDFTYVPSSFYPANTTLDWYIEESRIKGGYNNTDVDLGVRAYVVEPESEQKHRATSLIYSGPLNSRTGVNNTNQFPIGEDISVSLDPSNGSVQKLFAENTNLTIFQELKVSTALIDKDAIYSAEGRPITTSSNLVIGQIQAYAGQYGISTHPESFAVFGYRKYFTDSNKGLVLRLSQDGITEISNYGMRDYFGAKFENVTDSSLVLGGWDQSAKQYVLSIQPIGVYSDYATLSFDESSNGWTSFYSYKPDDMISLRNHFYSISESNVWKHYSRNVNRGSFYGVIFDSKVQFIFNGEPSMVKKFNTINYEGDPGWQVDSLLLDSNINSYCVISPAPVVGTISTLGSLESQLFINNFKLKENKYFANIFNNSAASSGEVVYGQSISGVRGMYANITMSISNLSNNIKSELFAVSSEYMESSY